ncbi:MAG: hypothetical protein IT337_11110 [Thermomicrobiales bacterium]|nr:hypothetical protein [Thermomicrobiales bacterium]
MAQMRLAGYPQRMLAMLLVLYLLKQLFSVGAFPAFSGHDELAHFAYIGVLADQGRLPVLPDVAAWRQLSPTQRISPEYVDQIPAVLYPYCRYALDWYCEPDSPRWSADPPRVVTVRDQYYPSGYIYTANHPPLYYAVMTPLYKLSAGWSPTAQQYLLRVAAIPFGVATVVLAFLLATRLFPGDRFLAVTVPALVALQPQISYEAAMVNNDIVSIAVFSAILYVLVLAIRDRFPRRASIALGVLLGLGLLTKGTMITAAPVIGFAALLAVGWRDVRGLARRAFWIGAPAAVLALPWYAYMHAVYGNFDALAQVSALQWWNNPEGNFAELLGSSDFVLMRFKETWGEYGWRLIHLGNDLLWAIGIVTALAIVGCYLYAATAGRHLAVNAGDPVMQPMRWQWLALATLASACAIAYLAVVQFGVTFSLTQARYYFPVVNAAALLGMLGLRTLIPPRWRPLGQGIIVAALIVLSAILFLQYVLPFAIGQSAAL